MPTSLCRSGDRRQRRRRDRGASSRRSCRSEKSFAEKTSEEAKAGPEQDRTSAAVDDNRLGRPGLVPRSRQLLRFAIPLDWKLAGPGRLDFIGPGGSLLQPKVNPFDSNRFDKFAALPFSMRPSADGRAVRLFTR